MNQGLAQDCRHRYYRMCAYLLKIISAIRFNEDADRFSQCCGCPLIPLGVPADVPGAACDANSTYPLSLDPVDEAIELYRPNSLFKTFDIRGPGDKLLVYLIIFINSCIRRIADKKSLPTREEARALLFSHAHDRFPLPGQAGFPLGALMQHAASKEDEETLRTYLRQCREETGRRLVERLYGNPGNNSTAAAPSKHWLAFANRRFLDRAM